MKNKHFTAATVFVVLVFILMLAHFMKLTLIDSGGLIVSSYNRRMSRLDPNVKKGSVYDASGRLLAESVAGENGYVRSYYYPNALFHLLGYNGGSAGASGVEALYNFKLQEIENEIYERIRGLSSENPGLRGSDITLTIDAELSQFIYEKIKNVKAAVAVIEPTTGRILALVSSPAADSNTIERDFSELRNSDDRLLLNRATNGLYEPASTFKIITAAAALKLDPALAEFSYSCDGNALADGTPFSCAGGKAHGELKMQDAFVVSCNSYFATLALEYLCSSERDLLMECAGQFFYNLPLGFELDYRQSLYEPIELGGEWKADVMQTAIGQGKTRASVLHQAMIAASIVNGGVMMKPFVLGGKKPEALGIVAAPEVCETLRAYMLACVSEGTGRAAGIPGAEIGGKTGTAQKSSEKDNSWFIGFSDEKPEIAIAVLVEDGAGGIATTIAGEIFSFIVVQIENELQASSKNAWSTPILVSLSAVSKVERLYLLNYDEFS